MSATNIIIAGFVKYSEKDAKSIPEHYWLYEMWIKFFYLSTVWKINVKPFHCRDEITQLAPIKLYSPLFPTVITQLVCVNLLF